MAVCGYVYVSAGSPQRPEMGIGFPGAEVIGTKFQSSGRKVYTLNH